MEDKFEKTPEQIKNQLETIFVKYYRKNKEDFNGNEDFTLFDLLTSEKQEYFKNKINLKEKEICVLILNCERYGQIINTTERFIRINEQLELEALEYENFIGHKGYKIFDLQPNITIKHDGHFEGFWLARIDGKIIFWMIPTGKIGFAFWNVTKKCVFIDQKYSLKK